MEWEVWKLFDWEDGCYKICQPYPVQGVLHELYNLLPYLDNHNGIGSKHLAYDHQGKVRPQGVQSAF